MRSALNHPRRQGIRALIAVGVERQRMLFSLNHIAEGEWRATFSRHPMWASAGYGVAATPWRAVQLASRAAIRQ